MAQPDLVLSRYLVFSPTTYRHPSGRQLRAVFHTGRARTLLLDTDTVRTLLDGPGPAGLPADEQARLAELGLLVPADLDETTATIDAGAQAADDARHRQFVLMPTGYCNMGCDYCGQEHRRDTPATRPTRHRDAIAARVEHAMASGEHDTVVVRWFGGEPLMGYAVLRSLSARFVAAAARHRVGYSAMLVTNGALLDARKLRTLHQDCRIDRMEITIDGPAEVHDAARPLKSGQSSFHRITAALRTVLTDPELAGLQVTVRTNIGRHNADRADEFAAAMRDAGLADPRIRFYPAPVHSWGNDVSEVRLRQQQAAETELRWYTAYLAAGLHCRLLPTHPVRVVCTAVSRHSEVIAPDGRIYSCTEQPLVPGFTEQHLDTVDRAPVDQLRPTGQFDDWYTGLRAGETGCQGCPILPVCGGACPKLWREGIAPCPPMKENLAGRIDLSVRSSGLLPV
ncbi:MULTISPECIES: radical SAM protein [unclassified Solwaraspora]|uniref:radical SAM/SPASM domain-containing protein n=1 Tax=unclassified Solwaraspora TaxID=2627926 RepID=UPI00248B1D3D|nr:MULTISPECIES: radical SAM protein [unclassified Solwaraspora]WBB98452.1 radical SAM protein [Solwaraspora sp. WMMA2059]WBC22995.1 radical SAM protein [Solwaraspora sp. WMMA2080]WJK34971.1 radical SAM protein [Solwaraspora sp. WMMA2065]